MSALRIFHVDDNPDDLFLLRTAIEESGAAVDYRPISDSHGALSVLRALSGSGQPPTLVLLDINMPVNGLDILRAIRGDAHLAALPVAILSSSRRHEDEQAATALGVRACLVKPRSYRDLLALIPRLVTLAN